MWFSHDQGCTASLWLQVALTKRITSKARLEEVARCVIAAATDKLLEVGLDEHQVSAKLQPASVTYYHRQLSLCIRCIHKSTVT